MDKESIVKKIKTFEDACRFLGLDSKNLPIVKLLPEKDWRSIIAYYKLIVITRALNEEWEPDFSDWEQYKYWNWFYMADGAAAGFVYAFKYDVPSYTYTHVGTRLCFKTRKLAMYAREQFRDLYLEFIFIDMPKNYGK
jgi:hypothetical protein